MPLNELGWYWYTVFGLVLGCFVPSLFLDLFQILVRLEAYVDVRDGGDAQLGLTFAIDVSMSDLLRPGGVDEFIAKAREMLEAKLEPLKAIAVGLATVPVGKNGSEVG